MSECKSIELVIISGVTGAIGSALFAEYAQRQNTVIYGISRKALAFEKLANSDGKLPQQTLVFSISGLRVGYKLLVEQIDFTNVRRVTYVHAMGLYPFEVDSLGNIVVADDRDGDGINDNVTDLTYNAFVSATQAIRNYFIGPMSCVIFGGLADKHKPMAHVSWWRTMEKTKEYMRQFADEKTSMIVCNISSVICPHEIITRPFVFARTDADQTYYLHPYELSKFVVQQVDATSGGFMEIEKCRIRPEFDAEHYKDEKFTPRKVRELYG